MGKGVVQITSEDCLWKLEVSETASWMREGESVLDLRWKKEIWDIPGNWGL